MSSGSDSDDDYIPGEPEKLSEEESADEETEAQYENDQEQKSKKRKSKSVKQSGKRRKAVNDHRRNNHVENATESDEEKEELKDPEMEKKKEDDLWAMFLDGTDAPKPKSSIQNTVTKVEKSSPFVKEAVKTTKNIKDDIKSREAKIFEFAGETVVVEGNEIIEVSSTASSSAAPPLTGTKPQTAPLKRGSGGLANVLGQLSKKNQLSTLEKSKLDWQTFKKKEGIEEELQTFNKGKDGYLERQDFLERADVRQFEIERNLRATRRSNR